jgi:hypothetical protein
MNLPAIGDEKTWPGSVPYDSWSDFSLVRELPLKAWLAEGRGIFDFFVGLA